MEFYEALSKLQSGLGNALPHLGFLTSKAKHEHFPTTIDMPNRNVNMEAKISNILDIVCILVSKCKLKVDLDIMANYDVKAEVDIMPSLKSMQKKTPFKNA